MEINEFRLLPVRSPLLGESKRSNRGRESLRRPRLPHCIFLSFPPATKMFQFAGSSSRLPMYSAADAPTASAQVSPFGDLRVKGCLPPHRSLSQAATSFIVFSCQGIHHILLLRFSHTFNFKSVKIYALFNLACSLIYPHTRLGC